MTFHPIELICYGITIGGALYGIGNFIYKHLIQDKRELEELRIQLIKERETTERVLGYLGKAIEFNAEWQSKETKKNA